MRPVSTQAPALGKSHLGLSPYHICLSQSGEITQSLQLNDLF